MTEKLARDIKMSLFRNALPPQSVFTARKRSLGQGNVLHLSVCSWGRGSAQPLDADPPRGLCIPPWMQNPLDVGLLDADSLVCTP